VAKEELIRLLVSAICTLEPGVREREKPEAAATTMASYAN
jgi:hypothetical protein